MKIHSTAIIDSKARLGPEVVVGPYTVIGPQAVIGAHSIIGSHVVIEGEVEMGEHNTVGHGAIIGTPPQDFSFESKWRTGVRIGAENTIRELCTIHRGTTEGSVTALGDKNFLMTGAHVGHNCTVGNSVVIANNCLLGGYVQVGDNAFLGGGCVFHQFVRVGRLAITQGASAFSMDIPPFVLAAERNYVMGLNVVGLRRAGFNPAERDQIKAAFKLIYLSGVNVAQGLARAKKETWSESAREFFEFIAAAKKRGICPLHGRTESTGDKSKNL